MKVKTIPSVLLTRDGRRMDSAPYMSGSQETKLLIERLDAPKAALRTLTHGYDGGIYNGPKFARNWVQAPEHGVPFLNSSDMLQADLTNLPYLRKSDAHSPRLSYLRLAPGMILISCTGTIGRMVYARPDMDGIWSSQHIMKVVPDPARIPPGYLYAFLSSKYGVPMIVGGTYGSIIQSIEPHHIADLPVPRLGEAVEQRAHALVEEAAQNRTNATRLLREARQELYRHLQIPLPRPESESSRPLIAETSSRQIQSRFDAFYYALPNREARTAFDRANAAAITLGEVADVFIPGIFKRRYALEPTFGYPYITGADMFNLAPTSDQFLMRKVAEEYGLVLKDGMIVIQEAGQLGGLIGRSVMVGRYVDGFACTNNMIRVTPNDKRDAGYLYALLSSEFGVRLIARESAGSSIPHIEASRIRNLVIPWPDQETRFEIAGYAAQALELSDAACDYETEARTLVERTIEGSA